MSKKSLMALTIGGCLLASLPPRAAADAPPADPSTAQADEGSPAIAVSQPETEQAPAPEESASGPQEIQEVIVTATKRAENVREIPASITAISGEELEQRGAQDTADIVKLVPGVNLTSTGDSPQRVTIRGISSDIGTSSTTGILFGNVSFTELYTPVVALDPNPFDMASVEVLKGPQGTLYGASALNGAVRYVPTLPKFDDFEVKWFGQYTSIHEGDTGPTYGAAVNVPLVDGELALRVMAFDRLAPGFIDNLRLDQKDTNRTDQHGARALLGWRPGDAWDVLLTTAWQQTKLRDVGIADDDQGHLETDNRPRRSPNRTKYSLVDLSATYSFDWAQFVSDTSYIDKTGRNFFDASSRTTGTGALALISQQYAGDSQTYGQEFRLVSTDDAESRWKWVAGLFAFRQDLKTILSVPLAVDVTPVTTILDTLTTVPLSTLLLDLTGLGPLFTQSGSPLVLQTAADVRVKEYAAFGELTRKLGDENQVEISLGGRLYRTSSGGENVQSGVYVLAQQRSVPFTVTGEVKQRGFNPKASILWHLGDDVLVYGLVSKGFRVGGVQPGLTSASVPRLFKSDTLWNYETGVRTKLLDNTLRVDLTGFWVDWKDPQSLQQDSSGLAVYIDNVGGVRSRGGDLSVQYLFPWAGLMFTTAASYADTVTTKGYTSANGSFFDKGSSWPLAPKWQTSSNLSFLHPAGNWVLSGYATYTSIAPTVPVFGGHRIFDYHQVDLQLSVSNEQIRWLPQVALILNNVTDERGLTNAFDSALAVPEYYYITPRSITVRLTGRFGG